MNSRPFWIGGRVSRRGLYLPPWLASDPGGLAHQRPRKNRTMNGVHSRAPSEARTAQTQTGVNFRLSVAHCKNAFSVPHHIRVMPTGRAAVQIIGAREAFN
jgi:hypothetical protein